jgi:hypothetical protein
MHASRRHFPDLRVLWDDLWIHVVIVAGVEGVAVERALVGLNGAPLLAFITSGYLTLIAASALTVRSSATSAPRVAREAKSVRSITSITSASRAPVGRATARHRAPPRRDELWIRPVRVAASRRSAS